MQRTPVVLVVCVVACLTFTVGGMNAAHPFVLASHMRDRNDDLERDLKRLKIQNQNDAKELKALETREGLILAARKYGYVLRGERKLRVPGTHP